MESLAKKYPKYYKALPPGVKPDEVDVYVINMMFPLDDPSGTLEHARKKLLVPGVRSGGKSMLKDITEARDTLNRYIALHSEPEVEAEPALANSFKFGQTYEHTSPGMPSNLWEGVWVSVETKDGRKLDRQPAQDWDWSFDMQPDGGHIARYTPEHAPGTRITDPIRAGEMTADGWIIHKGDDMPEALTPEQLVDVKLADGTIYEGNFAKPASEWVWVDDKTHSRITHYRLMRYKSRKDLFGELDKGLELVNEPGWFKHDSVLRPAGLEDTDKVIVRMSNGHTVVVPRIASRWNWAYRQADASKAPHIEAWRFA